MVLTAKDWGLEDTKKWFEGMCRYELSMSEKTWDLVIVPLFDEIFGMATDLRELETLMKYTEEENRKLKERIKERDEEINKLKKELHFKEKVKISFPKEINPYILPFTPPWKKTWIEDGPVKLTDFWCNTTTNQSEKTTDSADSKEVNDELDFLAGAISKAAEALTNKIFEAAVPQSKDEKKVEGMKNDEAEEK